MKVKWICLLFAVSVLFHTASASELADPRFDREMTVGIGLIMRQEYDSAATLFSRMVEKDKTYPAGYFMQTTLMAARFYDKNDTSSMKVFYATADRVIAITEGRTDPIYSLYRGATFAYLSVFLAKEGRWMSGALYGKKAADTFKKMLDSKVVSSDALGMLGAYHYWVSAVMKNFIWLPFLKDRREQGILEMAQGLRKAKYLRFALLNSLLWVYYDNGRYPEALVLCRQVLKDYPRHRIFLSIEMHILYKLKNYAAARANAVGLLKAYAGVEEAPVNYTAIRIKIALLDYSMGRKKEADALADSLASEVAGGYLKRRLEREFSILQKSRY